MFKLTMSGTELALMFYNRVMCTIHNGGEGQPSAIRSSTWNKYMEAAMW